MAMIRLVSVLALAWAWCCPAAWSQELPEGKGKEIVAAACGRCHEMRRIADAGFTPQGWQTVITRMRKLGLVLASDQESVLTDYLVKNFPEKLKTRAEIVPGLVEVTIKEWQVLTPGAHPHDPLATPDGAIWYTGQAANVLGRLDPKTGAIKEFEIKIPQSGPHGLVADADGNIWFTASYAGYIGKLDPRSGTFTEYKLPDPNARDPHTPIFDRKGILWFTVQSANMVGRLDPKTGEIRLVTVPTPRSSPYGMAVSSNGTPFFAEFGANKLASIDPQTMAIREYVLPNPQSRPRRIAITSDDAIWYSDYVRGYLGRFDPASGTAIEWPSPGGSRSQPYGIAALDDVIWYSESGPKPNTLVRFDPKTQKFQTWPIASGGGVVRNMMPTTDGNLALACSGVNRVALVEINARASE
jgi:virginiamycin B lyase